MNQRRASQLVVLASSLNVLAVTVRAGSEVNWLWLSATALFLSWGAFSGWLFWRWLR